MRPQSFVIALLPALLSGSIALAASNVSQAGSAWLNYVVRDSNGEIQMCQAADQKTNDASVHKLCARAIADHTKAAKQGTQLAQQLRVSVSQTPPEESVDELQKLKNLSGSTFVSEFKKVQVSDHQKDIAKTEKAIAASTNPQVKAFEQQTLGVLRTHLALAQQIH